MVGGVLCIIGMEIALSSRHEDACVYYIASFFIMFWKIVCVVQKIVPYERLKVTQVIEL